MALTDSEVQRIRYELGYVNLNTAAEPYIGIAAVFSAVIQQYTLGGLETSSSTPVTAAAAPTPQTLALGNAAGLAVGGVLVIDVDARQERATIQNVSGSNVTVLLQLAHTGTYPVLLESGETIIREILRELALLGPGSGGQPGAISKLRSRAGVKRVEEIEFFGGGSTIGAQGYDPISQMLRLREYWRDELARVLGIPRLNGSESSGGSEIGVY